MLRIPEAIHIVGTRTWIQRRPFCQMAKVLTRSATVAFQHNIYVIYSTASTQHNWRRSAKKKALQCDESSAMHLGLKGYISFIFIIQFFH